MLLHIKTCPADRLSVEGVAKIRLKGIILGAPELS